MRDVEALHPVFSSPASAAAECSPVTADRSWMTTNDHRFFLTGMAYARTGMSQGSARTSKVSIGSALKKMFT
jgi:hypothetical protein